MIGRKVTSAHFKLASSPRHRTMSFLPLDELEPTLSDVLAFIDAFSIPDSVQSSPTSSDITVASSAKRKQSRAAASRRFQHKKKAELLALRVQVSALQRRLHELQHNETCTAEKKLDETQRSCVVSAWMGKAELEKQLRLLSEARNRQLKTVLSRQKQTAKTVHRLLRNVTAVAVRWLLVEVVWRGW
jgi:flagellar biosynthesis GTPase FlhF